MRRTPGDPFPPQPTSPPTIDDDFSTGELGSVWVPHYLPHWTTPDRSAARLAFTPGGLDLRIDEDQLEWRPEDAPMRVSNLQTALLLGSPGRTWEHTATVPTASTFARTHRRACDTRRLPAVSTSRCGPAPTPTACPPSGWSAPNTTIRATRVRSASREIDADAVGGSTRVRCGLKAHHDDRLRTDMITTTVPHDAARLLTWSVEWGGGVTTIGCEGRVVAEFDQAPAYL